MLKATEAYTLSHKTWGYLKQIEMGIREATRLGATEILINEIAGSPAVQLALRKGGYIIEKEDGMFRIRWDSPSQSLGSESPNLGRHGQ